MNRRNCLTALISVSAAFVFQRANAHAGPVAPPVAAPDLLLVDQLGRTRGLRSWLSGHVTLAQTIFTGCSSICPIQGAHFAELQQRLAGQAHRLPVQLLSISIDALGDTPESLRAWLMRMHARPGWDAALPRIADLDLLRAALDSDPNTPPSRDLETHSDKVYVFNAQGQLVWRSVSLPSVGALLQVARHFAR